MKEYLSMFAFILLIMVLINWQRATGSYVNCRQDGGVVDVCLAGAAGALFPADDKKP